MAIRWALKAPCKAGWRSFYRNNHRWSKVHPPKKMGVSKNSGTPQIIHFNRVFHYKPSNLVDHYLRKPPNTLPETHSSPLKMDGWETRTFPFGMGSYVSFRECTILNPTNLRIWKIILHFIVSKQPIWEVWTISRGDQHQNSWDIWVSLVSFVWLNLARWDASFFALLPNPK